MIGSSCIGASVFGGVCNNSGGALVQRGPAYTQLSVFTRVDAEGINHLSVTLAGDEETLLSRLDRDEYDERTFAMIPATAPTKVTPTMSAISMSLPPPGSMPIPARCLRLRGLPAK
ncbi:hypothetical protein [Sodalis glossinidius]|uniref:hypothetical protein n=1 Tax=Sodalis glossinidius TaxID=63612 RepID=UPI003C776EF0